MPDATYSLHELTRFTGLTDRTLRSYLASDILQGEKINGAWRFTPEQLEAFLSHPAVRPSILAKHHSMVYDFLLDTHKAAQEACVVLDVSAEDLRAVSSFFCDRINQDDPSGIRFSFQGKDNHARVILTGHADAVLRLASDYPAL